MANTMLIVDDVDIERRILKRFLQDEYTILEADDGEQCMDILMQYKEQIDVIILDLMMPKMDGFEVLRRKMELDYARKIPVLVLTASGAHVDLVKAFELGANDFITKPFVTQVLKVRIHNAVVSHRRMLHLIEDNKIFKTKSEIDLMTGLYNKFTMENIINDILDTSDDRMHAMFLIDIDNFKAVNDIEGHQVGDHTIQIIADLISGVFRDDDIVGRFGGDEFIVLMKNIPTKKSARKKGQEILNMMQYRKNLSIPVNVTLSIGIAFTDETTTDFASIFTRVDKALYTSKKSGKARISVSGMDDLDCGAYGDSSIALCSENRNTCAIIRGVLGNEHQFIDIPDVVELSDVYEENKENLQLVFVDISHMEDMEKTKTVLNQITPNTAVILLCKEGCIDQYRMAVQVHQVRDVMTIPLEPGQLKRRMNHILTLNN